MDNPNITAVEAVNLMLTYAGFPEVSSIDTSIPHVDKADKTLNRVSREVQAMKLKCNYEYKYPLTPNAVTKEINIPSNTLRIDGFYVSTDITERGGKLYNIKDQTYEFDDIVEVDIVFMLDFEDLPKIVKNYIMIKATRKFQGMLVGSNAVYAYTQQEEIDALRELQRHELLTQDNNIFNDMSGARPLLRKSYANASIFYRGGRR